MKTDALWYKDAIFYELHVRTFADSNADGIGDFAGARQKLDYLQDLGITCIWLLPFYQSPLRDDGYDVSTITKCIRPTARCRRQSSAKERASSSYTSPPRISLCRRAPVASLVSSITSHRTLAR